MHDPVLEMLPARDVSVYIFGILYLSILVTLFLLLPFPFLLLKGMQAYFILNVLRVITIYFFPLEAPENIQNLHDPFIGHFFYNDVNITKDLFFSGHVSTMFLVFLLLSAKRINYLFLFLTFVQAILILVQHTHYSFDVLAAPVFVWVSFWTAGSLQPLSRKSRKGNEKAPLSS